MSDSKISTSIDKARKFTESSEVSSNSSVLDLVDSNPSRNELQPLDAANSARPRSSSFTQGIKSTAVVKYNVPQPQRFRFLRLDGNTNLKKPPENWLRMQFWSPSSSVAKPSSPPSSSSSNHGHYFGKPDSYFWSYPFSKSPSWSMFSSFRMANQFPDALGEVDVISDAENIKTLLKIPFSDSRISMMVHRIEKSLLLDEFDVSKYLLRAEEKQWQWLRTFLYKHLLLNGKKGCLTSKKVSRNSLQFSSMYDKFLHYSVEDFPEDPTSNVDEVEYVCPEIQSIDHKSITSASKALELDQASIETALDLMAGYVDEASNNHSNRLRSHSFMRNVFWTFEDIQMLVGSDMPIFGDANHPAVSLRLRDVKEPINILTGIDYWLDNLMCSVPELVMCYHLDGIVQKYELINTEDIPSLKNSQFSRKIIRNISQNILSFLKSRATKSGHTYWLFKSRRDDVVKLYDLTSLCAGSVNEESYNPYSLPVAMLLYKMAKNIKESGSKGPRTVYRLLTNCLHIITDKRYFSVAISARYLLADLIVPCNVNLSEEASSDDKNESDSDEDEYDEGGNSGEDETISAITVDELKGVDTYCDQRNRPNRRDAANSKGHILNQDWKARCLESLELIKTNLDQIILKISEASYSENSDEVFKSDDAIPMGYEPLASQKSQTSNKDLEIVNNSKSGPDGLVKHHDGNIAQYNLQLMLNLHKCAQILSILAEIFTNQKQHAASLKILKTGYTCCTMAKRLTTAEGTEEILPCLYGLAGDNHFMILKESQASPSCDLSNVDQEPPIIIKDLLLILRRLDQPHEDPCFDSSLRDDSSESRLNLSARCYDIALSLRTEYLNTKQSDLDGKTHNIDNDELIRRLYRKLGHISNDLGTRCMNNVTRILEAGDDIGADGLNALELTKESRIFLERGYSLFEKANDSLNCVLVTSNLGRLMRVCAHISTKASKNSKTEISSKERKYYLKAIRNYEKALSMLDAVQPDDDITVNIKSRLTWDLGSTYYTLGTLLQDYAPLSYRAQEQVEREVDECLTKALELIENSNSNCNEIGCLYDIRRANIYYRLGSLFHHSFRNKAENDAYRKKYFNLADNYHKKAHEIYLRWENRNEFLNNLLEQVALHDQFFNSTKVGDAKKVRLLSRILNLLTSCSQILSKDKESIDQDESTDYKRLMQIIFSLFDKYIETMLKLSSKNAKNDVSIKSWRRLHMEIAMMDVISLSEDTDKLEKNICDICDACSKLLEKNL